MEDERVVVEMLKNEKMKRQDIRWNVIVSYWYLTRSKEVPSVRRPNVAVGLRRRVCTSKIQAHKNKKRRGLPPTFIIIIYLFIDSLSFLRK